MDTKTVSLPEILNIPPKLHPIIFELNDYELFLLEGGRGSAKSHSVARLLLFLGEQKKLRIVCGREIQANIEESVYALMKDLIEEFGLAYDVMARKIKHKLTGTEINFKGFREQGNVSVKGLEGVDILWIDEAQSITKPTLDIIMPTMRKSTVKVIFTMNRFLREDAVPEYAVGRDETLHIQINYFDNPFCPAILKRQALEMRDRSERDYRHIWLGEPLQQADDYLFNFDKLHGSFDVEIFGDMVQQRQRVMAFDFAAQGNDLCVGTVLDRMSNQHWKPVEIIPWDEPDTMVSVGKIVAMIGQFKPDIACIDIGGMGKPVYDRLLEVGIDIIPFDGGSTQGIDKKAYANNRAFGYYTVKDWLDAGFLAMDKVKDREVVKELEKIKMKYRSNGCRVIQAKVDMKKELGYSPDHADSLMMAVWCAANHLGASSNANNAGSMIHKVTRVSRNTAHRRSNSGRRSR
tara:strand:- start:16229 stop:17614 length:1386 start_codon:yes stop_codon:yes gene_type:complete